ncbi:hypothetical protein H310_04713 [Aphanomyces invadans]|uniref:Mitochondrial carrier protein n=1 Tax=Aphanomyces invadans TaxID=157072 RepID=A0A024UDW7_9STRA|nr:hypothetical protein H310_04713 [Aphanomyces invadans]ETW04439.1 hypothetical protein H310_04713 [Aphanomyces invadans]RHY30251.1 hypothetical protein DYB32_004473 [Aphanomyces invadans]|eukprot:XP_008867395.1 hypothetical protein H310_04713 [Aphanomyces invadans]
MTSTTNKTLATSAAISQINGVHSVLAGVFAGCVTRSCTSPMDVLKILFQVNHPTAHRSIHHACQQLYVSEGLRGFWKGNLAGCFRLGPYAGVKFCIFDTLQSKSAASAPHVEKAVHGAIAGMCATLAVYPMEVVRTRIIMQDATAFRGIHKELTHIYRKEGMRGLYRGCLSGLVGSIPFEGIQFACYEYSKSYAVQQRWPAWRWPEHKHQLNSLDHLVIGSWSGAIAQLVSYPFDSVKKRLQADTAKRYTGMLDCLDKVVREEGAVALYRGTLPNMVRVVPYAAVMFASYEAAKDFLSSL